MTFTYHCSAWFYFIAIFLPYFVELYCRTSSAQLGPTLTGGGGLS